jgi:AcrR family transcriptional regulator
MGETLATAPPRRRDAEATRGRILAAAMERFARRGYETASLRDIAAEAGVDVALIGRYFGGKEGLFTAALKASIHPRLMHDWDRASLARELATHMADGPHSDEERHHSFQFLIRAATSPATAPLLNLAVQERFLGPLGEWLGGDDPLPRARVLAAVYIGFLVERLIRGEALAGLEREVFIEQVATVLTTLISDPVKA